MKVVPHIHLGKEIGNLSEVNYSRHVIDAESNIIVLRIVLHAAKARLLIGTTSLSHNPCVK
jgi:hypothetical protein